MKRKTIILLIVLAAIVALIFYFESTKPDVASGPVDADIVLEQETTERVLTQADQERIAAKAERFERAKELVDPEGYINGENTTLAQYIGNKVILVDFWTYSCINCQRTLPYLTAWYDKYADDGLVIIGVHTPEFAFEEEYENVLAATEQWDIEYPVVQDNDRQTWRAYNNRYWPRKYLIDIDGFIVYDHIGEGAYAETEQKIQELLQERNEILNVQETVATGTVTPDVSSGNTAGRTAEVYFGYDFARNQLGNSQGWQPEEVVSYTLPGEQEQDLFYLDGEWKNNPDNMEVVSEKGTISLNYFAKTVHFVAGADEPVTVEVFLDGEKVNEVTVEGSTLYTLVDLEKSGAHHLELQTTQGLEAYTFTFG